MRISPCPRFIHRIWEREKRSISTMSRPVRGWLDVGITAAEEMKSAKTSVEGKL